MITEFFNKLCNILYVYLYISWSNNIKAILFFNLHSHYRESSFHRYAFRKKKKNSFRTILMHQGAISITESNNKDRSGIHPWWCGARLERSICTSSLCASMEPSIRPLGRRSAPYWRILFAETERVKRRDTSGTQKMQREKKRAKKPTVLPRS